MFLATLSIICKCGILGIGCMSVWCAREWVSIPGERDLQSLNWCSHLELRQVRTHAHTYRRDIYIHSLKLMLN